MRWEDLFADLELQWEANEAAELASELADRSRREAGYLRMIDRMRPVVGYPTRLRVLGGQHAGESLHGTLAALGMDWLLLRTGGDGGPGADARAARRREPAGHLRRSRA